MFLDEDSEYDDDEAPDHNKENCEVLCQWWRHRHRLWWGSPGLGTECNKVDFINKVVFVM